MRRRELNRICNWILLAAAAVAFSTGVVILIGLHMGDGPFRRSLLGVDRMVWLDAHRLSALLVAAGVVAHLALHWRPFYRRLANLVRRRSKRRFDIEPIMYGALLVSTVTGLVAWWLVGGSSPLLGPAVLGRASGARHPWIDTHHIASLLSLVLVAHHVGHRWRLMVRRAHRPG